MPGVNILVSSIVLHLILERVCVCVVRVYACTRIQMCLSVFACEGVFVCTCGT